MLVGHGRSDPEPVPALEDAIDPRLSDDGRRVAFVRGGELHVLELGSGSLRQLTTGARDGVTHGLAEFVAAEELDRDRGFWWSPDGSSIAYATVDSRGVTVVPIVHQGTDRPETEEHRYPFAGEANAIVELSVVDVATGHHERLDLGPDPDIYLARVAWRPDGALTAQLLSRDQRTLRTVLLAPAAAPRTLVEERGDPWINLDEGPRFLRGGEMLFTSERSGHRHLYLHIDGLAPRPLTGGDWAVTRVAGVNERRRLAFVEATRASVLERHLYAVALDGGETRRITGEPGWHQAVLSRDGERFVDTFSSLACAPRLTLGRSDGNERIVLFENPQPDAEALGLRPPELLELPAADGTRLHAALYRAPDRAAPMPLIVSVYGGPHAQRVADEWSLTVDLRAQYLAQSGYAVLKVDNRGSANRGLAFESALAGRMGTIEIDDQAAAVEALVERGELDGGRVGIYGWSYGGYLTLMAMLRRPDLFRVGVAGAPVTDWAGYDTGYTERYMGTPRSNPDGYREGSVLTHAGRLRGELLLVHGMIDENVHFRHTARLMVALAAAGKRYELLAYPEERHMPRDAAGLEYQERRLVDHFAAHLPAEGGKVRPRRR